MESRAAKADVRGNDRGPYPDDILAFLGSFNFTLSTTHSPAFSPRSPTAAQHKKESDDAADRGLQKKAPSARHPVCLAFAIARRCSRPPRLPRPWDLGRPRNTHSSDVWHQRWATAARCRSGLLLILPGSCDETNTPIDVSFAIGTQKRTLSLSQRAH